MCATVFAETVAYHVTRHGFSVEDLGFGDPGDAGVALFGDRLFVRSPRASGQVPITIRVEDREPAVGHEPWTRVVDIALRIRSVHVSLRTAEWADHHLAIPPNDYIARVFFGDIESVDHDSFLGDDHYLLMLWPGLADGITIRKAHDGTSTWPASAFQGSDDVDVLIEQARRGDVHARRHAVRVLGLLGTERGAAAIAHALTDESPFVREVAVTAASHFGSQFEEQVSWFTAEPSTIVPGEDRAVWCRCAEALGRIGSRTAGDRLEALLASSRDEYVRAHAARALAATGDSYWLDALSTYADDEDEYVRQVVDEAIRTLTGR